MIKASGSDEVIDALGSRRSPAGRARRRPSDSSHPLKAHSRMSARLAVLNPKTETRYIVMQPCPSTSVINFVHNPNRNDRISSDLGGDFGFGFWMRTRMRKEYGIHKGLLLPGLRTVLRVRSPASGLARWCSTPMQLTKSKVPRPSDAISSTERKNTHEPQYAQNRDATQNWPVHGLLFVGVCVRTVGLDKPDPLEVEPPDL